MDIVDDAGIDPLGTGTNPLACALRETARRLRTGPRYQWSHQGACNCGHLAQTLTQLPAAEIHRRALERSGDWFEHARDYCPSSGYPIDHIIETMLSAGMTRDDIGHLERLDAPAVLAAMAPGRYLHRGSRADAIRYMETWADLLECGAI